jgi:hypothetical protein
MLKKTLSAVVALGLASTASVLAQGTVSFNNRVLDTDGVTFLVNAPVFDSNGTTLLAGAAYMAALYAGPDDQSLAQVGAAVVFRTGTREGYVDITSPDRTISTVAAGGSARIQIRAWEAAGGATYEAALAGGFKTGVSGTISVTTGGSGNPPSLPANLIGLQSFNLVPEPSVVVLGLLGACGLFLRRRKA